MKFQQAICATIVLSFSLTVPHALHAAKQGSLGNHLDAKEHFKQTASQADSLSSTKILGTVDGFGRLRNDDVVDMAFVLPSITEEQLLSFDLAGLLSPNEELKVGPVKSQVPGNLYVPKQWENWGLLPLKIRKENFTILHTPGERTELFSIAVQAPFNDLVDKGRAGAKKAELMKLITFNKLGFASAQDWSRYRSPIELSLNQSRPRKSTLVWDRTQPAANDADIVLQVEETPMGRWVLSDANTDPQRRTDLWATGASTDARLIVGRSFFDSNDKFEAVKAWLHPLRRGYWHELDGLPESVEQLSWKNSSEASWQADERKGFVSLFVERRANAQSLWLRSLAWLEENELFPALTAYLQKKSDRRIQSSGWVPFESGSLTLDAPVDGNDAVELIFISGDSMNEPSLKKADQVVVHNLQ